MDIIETLTDAVSLLNNMDEYINSLVEKQSKCDQLIADYQHFIENTSIDEVDLNKLFTEMQNNFKTRRIVKEDMELGRKYKSLTTRLSSPENREIMLSQIKTTKSCLGKKYSNNILNEDDVNTLMTKKKKAGRPKKLKEGV